MITVKQLAQLAPACDADVWAPELTTAAETYSINTTRRLSHWLGQLFIESAGFTRFEENLNYSAERLHAVWPGRFPTVTSGAPFAHNPQALANKVYGGRLGNVAPDDGWAYRGRGPIQITGRDNYQRYGLLIGADLRGNPEMLLDPRVSSAVAGAYWSVHGLNELADSDNIEAITRAINGGLTGLPERTAAVARAKHIFGLQQT